MNSKPISTAKVDDVRWGVRFTGIVQGVGFRPLVAVIAGELQLTGFVYNDSAGVYAEVQGRPGALQAFTNGVQRRKASIARIDDVKIAELPVVPDDDVFVIAPSPEGSVPETFIGADSAPCAACLAEMKDPTNRRYNYEFINCTHCGPRYTIVESVPYDRARTSMKEFPMCDECAAEYSDVTNRRYHTEPNACPVCGPSYRLLNEKGIDTHIEEPLDGARKLIEKGLIVAIKGIGGYHLACDGRNEEAVQRLRQLKQRPDKPLALMVDSLETATRIACVSKAEAKLMSSPARPIVLVRRRVIKGKLEGVRLTPTGVTTVDKDACLFTPGDSITPAESVAPNTAYLGIMLPYAPIHYALLPEGAVWVMTSGNRSGDPVLYEDDRALEELKGIADAFLVHNRKIVAPVDDSVQSIIAKRPFFYRRSRGYVPQALDFGLPSLGDGKKLPAMLAVGSDLKNAFAMNKNTAILPGPHIGDLANEATYRTLVNTVERYTQLFGIEPEAVIVDKHPNYMSSAFGADYSETHGIPLIKVQHHHAHIAGTMAEYGVTDPVLGICFDGTGYGEDGTVWGGEFLVCHDAEFQRVGHLPYAPLPGGEAAVKEPWRQALWYIRQLYGDDLPAYWERRLQQFPSGWQLLDEAMKKGLPMTRACGAGRLYDAVGALLDVGYVHSFDGQVAMALEQLADGERGRLWEFNFDGEVLDFTPLLKQLTDGMVKGMSRRVLAASFHRTLAYGIQEAAEYYCERYGLHTVIYSGGVFQNRRLLQELLSVKSEQRILLPRQMSPNDGGLAVGQLWLGAKQLGGI